MNYIKTFLILLTLNVSASFAQTSPFDVYLQPLTITGLPGIQSYAFGQYDGKWLIAGGRTDGLHRRQPFAAFDVPGENSNLWVVDPVNQQFWSAPLTGLPTAMQEQLSSTNMEFYQQDSFLYCIGGYGYSNIAADHVTYNNLTAINVPLVIDAIVNGNSFAAYFRQITDAQFAVTGGRLEKIYNTWFLVGGQNFTGEYNPMGMPTFTQVYSNQIRKFILSDDGTTITISHLPVITDTANLHRRDYNVIPQILPNGQEGLTAFSGVFQTAADIPYLNCVNIDSSGYAVNNSFAQYYNHYHCANFPLYSASANEMHNVFFGGIAQYYDSSGVLTQDNNVPFVKTIARVSRDGNGTMTEYKLPVDMISLLGAGAEFIRINGLPDYPNHVLKLDSIITDTTLVGYIYGGISSSAANIFFANTGTQSSAYNQLLKVYLIKNSNADIHELNPQSTGSLQMQVYPNPSEGIFSVKFNLVKTTTVKLSIIDMNGKTIKSEILNNLTAGENLLSYKIKNLSDKETYMVTIETSNEKVTQKIIIND
jgi:hypothetical protein